MNSISSALSTYAGGGDDSAATLTIKSSPPKTAQVASRLGVRAGWMTKRNEQNQWQRRFCVLVPQTLLYYFDDSRTESARGVIDLEYYTEVEMVAEKTIRLATPPDIPLRSFFFKAESEEQCATWVSALSRERYFEVADERDAYHKLQTEFQKQSSETAEMVDVHREAIAAARGTLGECELRQEKALRALSAQAVALGLGADAAVSLRDAKDALRELAHRLHYHMRRSTQLTASIEVAQRRAEEVALALRRRDDHAEDDDDDYADDALSEDALSRTSSTLRHSAKAVSVENGAPTTHDASARLREVDELREKLEATRRAREREATARAALAADKSRMRARLDELQQSVAVTARARVIAEQKAVELTDQKRILVKEIKQLMRRSSAISRGSVKRALLAPVTSDAASASSAGDLEEKPEDEQGDSHRELALQRAGLAGVIRGRSTSESVSDAPSSEPVVQQEAATPEKEEDVVPEEEESEEQSGPV